jgi:hypothetical protein
MVRGLALLLTLAQAPVHKALDLRYVVVRTALETQALISDPNCVPAANLLARTNKADDALILGRRAGRPDAAAVHNGQLFVIRWHQVRARAPAKSSCDRVGGQ